MYNKEINFLSIYRVLLLMFNNVHCSNVIPLTYVLSYTFIEDNYNSFLILYVTLYSIDSLVLVVVDFVSKTYRFTLLPRE